GSFEPTHATAMRYDRHGSRDIEKAVDAFILHLLTLSNRPSVQPTGRPHLPAIQSSRRPPRPSVHGATVRVSDVVTLDWGHSETLRKNDNPTRGMRARRDGSATADCRMSVTSARHVRCSARTAMDGAVASTRGRVDVVLQLPQSATSRLQRELGAFARYC